MALTARQKAQAAEALIRFPDLTPAARRVGLELLNLADRKTGISWPSEARMAEALAVDVRTIRRGKADLRAAGLLTWQKRGRHKTPVYKLAWDRLVELATAIKTRVQAACSAARKAITTARADTRTSASQPVQNPAENGPASDLERTIRPAYPTQQGLKRAGEERKPFRGTQQRQILSDRELDARASARFWTALKALGPHLMAQFIAHPHAEEFQNAAIRAERFKPNHGRTGLNLLVARLREMGA